MASHAYAHQEQEEQPIGELFSELSGNLQQLMRKEVELAKVEATEQAKRAGKAGAMFGATAVAGFFGVLLVLFAAAWGLAEAIPAGLAFLAVGLLCLVVAGIFAASAKKKVAEIRPPQQTVETLKQDVQVAQTSLKRGLQSETTNPWKGR
jgi:VIT1/CCC1 family predicted Fe2+/Mn2+ transporter